MVKGVGFAGFGALGLGALAWVHGSCRVQGPALRSF